MYQLHSKTYKSLNTMKKLLLISLITVSAIAMSTTSIEASNTGAEQTQKQKIKQEQEFKCNQGSYGEFNCYFKGTQEAEQEQTQKLLAQTTSTGKRIHIPVNTAADMQTTAVIMAFAFIGLGASLALTKMQNA